MNIKQTQQYQQLLSGLKIFTQTHGDALSELGLNLKVRISLKTALSGYNQIIQNFSLQFNLPNEITCLIFDYLSIPDLHEKLGATFQQLSRHVKITGFEVVKNQLKSAFEKWIYCDVFSF